ncbi:MAG: hypothetical protein CFE47_04810 [Pseudomonas sp. PGPPP1]|uniref:hypothetical protein n=1 Tax=Pseudomonas sp. PGPPP1 TaxID=2015553 RepID=UPI000BC6BE5D|nr:hypothetical protein [Pseudomonas sp. PGPPP1]OYU08471.1 MAG: hypothetical protein CFE47_04810 [Pseudomonas sp. PGPPP1]
MNNEPDPSTNAINEIAFFDTPGDTRGWTGEGEILPDDPDGNGPVNRWFSTGVKRDFGNPFSRQTTVRVVIRLRGQLPRETLQGSGPDGIIQEIHNIEPVKTALYEFFLRSTPAGEFSVQFNFATRQKMVIQTIQVNGPV